MATLSILSMDNIMSGLDKNILFLTKYDTAGASSRYRTYQYLPFLKNYSYTVSSLLSGQYLKKRFISGRSSQIRLILKAYFIRLFFILKSSKDYDLLIIEYELLPYFPAWLEGYLHWRGIPYIVDYDDALFHQYDHHRNSLIRRLLGNKIAKVMKYSSHVITGNQYLSNYAEYAGARQVSLIPTVIDLEHYSKAQQINKADIFTVVWIGSSSTTSYLQEVIPSLQALSKCHTFRLRLIGASEIDLPGINVERLDWEQGKEVEHLSQCHIGIMPLPDTLWAHGKCGFKLIQYMACSLPVIASPIGVNTEIVDHGENGFLASDTKGWINAVQQLLQKPRLVQSMGAAGYKKIAQGYCVQVSSSSYLKILEDISR